MAVHMAFLVMRKLWQSANAARLRPNFCVWQRWQVRTAAQAFRAF
jgi:hypothetical protein